MELYLLMDLYTRYRAYEKAGDKNNVAKIKAESAKYFGQINGQPNFYGGALGRLYFHRDYGQLLVDGQLLSSILEAPTPAVLSFIAQIEDRLNQLFIELNRLTFRGADATHNRVVEIRDEMTAFLGP